MSAFAALCARARVAATGALIVGWVACAPACELPPILPGPAPRVLLHVDGSRSSVAFDAKAFLHSFSGRTTKVRGVIGLADRDSPEGATACFRVDAASLETGNAVRDATMRDDHLQTRRFPTIAFDLTQIEDARRTPDGWEFVARGGLTLRDVTRQTQFAVRARRQGTALRFAGEVPVKMTDHGVPVPTFLFLTVEDQVLVRFDLTATPAP